MPIYLKSYNLLTPLCHTVLFEFGDHSPGTDTFPQTQRGYSSRPQCPESGRRGRFPAAYPERKGKSGQG